MQIKRADLNRLIESYLLESTDKKLFKGEYFTLGDVKGASYITSGGRVKFRDGYSHERAIYLLPKGSEGKNIKNFKILTYEYYTKIPGQKTWVSELDDYSDYSQNSFFKHLQANRLAYGDPRKAIKEISGEIKNFEDTWTGALSDTAIDSTIAIAGLFPATQGLSAIASIARAAESLIKEKYSAMIGYIFGAIPNIGGPIRSTLAPFTKTATRQAAIAMAANAPGIYDGILTLIETFKEKKQLFINALEQVIGKAKEIIKNPEPAVIHGFTGPIPSSEKLFSLIIEFFKTLASDLKIAADDVKSAASSS